MIRINLLGGERKAKKQFAFQDSQKITIGCTGLVLLTAAFIGWRYWSIDRDSASLNAQIAAGQKEAVRLHTIITQVQQFEQRKSQLQQRVTLIERLRKEQSGPVHMLDQISRSLPSMLWLTELKQTPDPNEVVITGQCTNLISLTDFVKTLEASGYFKKSIDIVSTQTAITQQQEDLVTFVIRVQFQRPGDPAPTPEAPAATQVAKRS